MFSCYIFFSLFIFLSLLSIGSVLVKSTALWRPTIDTRNSPATNLLGLSRITAKTSTCDTHARLIPRTGHHTLLHHNASIGYTRCPVDFSPQDLPDLPPPHLKITRAWSPWATTSAREETWPAAVHPIQYRSSYYVFTFPIWWYWGREYESLQETFHHLQWWLHSSHNCANWKKNHHLRPPFL